MEYSEEELGDDVHKLSDNKLSTMEVTDFSREAVEKRNQMAGNVFDSSHMTGGLDNLIDNKDE